MDKVKYSPFLWFFWLLLWSGWVAANDLLAYLSPGESGYWQVWILDPSIGTSRQLSKTPYDKSTLSWYPGGQQILVNGSQGELAIVTVEDGGEQAIKTEIVGFNDAVLSPDGRQIAFSMRMTGRKSNNDIWLIQADGGQLRKLTNMAWFQGQPTWSPDGNTIYFASGKFEQVHDIWSLELKSGNQRQLTQNQRFHFDIAAAPDGQLLFSGNRSGNYDIWLRHIDGQSEQLTQHEGLDANPVWSPGGEEIVFDSTRDGRPQLYSLNLENRKLNKLTYAKLGARFPRWSLQMSEKE